MNWFVVQTMGSREIAVQNRLSEIGVASYLPKIKIADRPAALWPGYLLVEARPAWYPIRWTVGVARLLMNGDRPAQLASSLITDLQRREKQGFIRMPKQETNRLRPGQKVRVISGSFCGLTGLCDGMTGNQRVRVLLELLGQAVPVDMPARAVEPCRLSVPQS
jgi:transcriptional antiterminator RfaH